MTSVRCAERIQHYNLPEAGQMLGRREVQQNAGRWVSSADRGRSEGSSGTRKPRGRLSRGTQQIARSATLFAAFPVLQACGPSFHLSKPDKLIGFRYENLHFTRRPSSIARQLPSEREKNVSPQIVRRPVSDPSVRSRWYRQFTNRRD